VEAGVNVARLRELMAFEVRVPAAAGPVGPALAEAAAADFHARTGRGRQLQLQTIAGLRPT
jgi:hypothetical protein